MAEHSRDYHDYVIRDGRLIGDFDAMYRHSATVPWHQDQQADWIDVRLTVQLLQDVGPFEEIHDLGCGLGYYLQLMRERVGAAGCSGFGYDISPTACEKAAALFPECKFQTLDLSVVPQQATRPVASGARRLFILRGTLWYVFPHLAAVIESIRALMAPEDLLLVVQNFPPLDRPFVGKDVLPDHHALLRHFGAQFVLTRHLWYEDARKASNDNWFIGLFCARQA